jgi:hypothetical protein
LSRALSQPLRRIFRAKAGVSDAKTDIIKWMFGTIGFQTVIIIGAVIALARLSHP